MNYGFTEIEDTDMIIILNLTIPELSSLHGTNKYFCLLIEKNLKNIIDNMNPYKNSWMSNCWYDDFTSNLFETDNIRLIIRTIEVTGLECDYIASESFHNLFYLKNILLHFNNHDDWNIFITGLDAVKFRYPIQYYKRILDTIRDNTKNSQILKHLLHKYAELDSLFTTK